VLREILHNAIAHQDYSRGGRISVVEFESRIVVGNPGTFLPGNVEDVIRRDAPFSEYRNPFLAHAMVGLKMIDTIGSGIKRVYQARKKRSFPMPDYDLTQGEEGQVSVIGKVIDEKYTQMLMARSDLDLWEAIALDKVQKGKPITDDEFKPCKRKKLVEGRRPNLHVSAEKAEYIRNRAFDKEHYQKMVLSYPRKFGEAKRGDIARLLIDKLSDTLDNRQKIRFIGNLLQQMRVDGLIEPEGAKRWARWRLTPAGAESAD
jgi:ATP-dependent DNA helicase RecG